MTKLFTLSLLVISTFFLSILPLHIQGGDTAELVNASFNLLVPHPPGYPLFLWLQHLWTHVFQLQTVFWRASFFNSLLGLGAISVVILPQRKSILGTLLLLSLATQSEFIEASVLPDVFALHGLIVALLGWLFFYVHHPRKFFLIPFLFFLGASNHHTIIFYLPCLLFTIWEGRRDYRSHLLMGLSLGVLVASGLYLSLFLLRTDHPYSWGNLKDFSSLLSHVLRKEYGTFKLSAHESFFDGRAYVYLLKSLSPYTGIFFFLFMKGRSLFSLDKKFRTFLFCFLITLLFPLLMNVAPVYMGEEILRRFHVMPLILLITLLTYLTSVLNLDKKSIQILMLLFVPVFLLNFYHLPGFFHLRHDSLIEDHSKNLLKVAQKYKPGVVLADNDSSFFALRYLQTFQPQKDVVVIAPSLFFFPWYVEKIQQQMPSFILQDQEKVFSEKFLSLPSQVIKPNLPLMNFVLMRDYKDGDWYKVTFTKLGRVVQEGSGVYFDQDFQVDFKKTDFPSGAQSATKSYLYWQYSFYYLAMAVHEESQNNLPLVRAHLEEALRIVPYAKHALSWLCRVKVEGEVYPLCLPEKRKEISEKARYLN
jgi:hypothetical protein